MSDGWPPEICNMPCIDDLWGYNVLTHTLNMVFRGGGPKAIKSRALVSNYIRIVDQAVRQYKSAKEAFEKYLNTPNDVIGPIFVSVGYFEALLSSLKRAIKFAERIRRDRDCPPISNALSIFSTTSHKTITYFRNAIEHLDEEIYNDTQKEGDPITLLIKDNSIELSGIEISYKSMETWIRELDDIARKLAIYREENA